MKDILSFLMIVRKQIVTLKAPFMVFKIINCNVSFTTAWANIRSHASMSIQVILKSSFCGKQFTTEWAFVSSIGSV